MTELADLTSRARAIFGHIVEAYLKTGAPIGSKNLADVLDEKLSPASIRSAMAELEAIGLLSARLVPMVDHTAKLVSALLSAQKEA